MTETYEMIKIDRFKFKTGKVFEVYKTFYDFWFFSFCFWITLYMLV